MPRESFYEAERVTAGELAAALAMLADAVRIMRDGLRDGVTPSNLCRDLAVTFQSAGSKLCPVVPAPDCGFQDGNCSPRMDFQDMNLDELIERIGQLVHGCAIVLNQLPPDQVLWTRPDSSS